MFSQACVKNSIHGGVYPSMHLGRYPPGRYTSLGRYILLEGKSPWQVHPPGSYIPPAGSVPSRRILEETVRILLECILVYMCQRIHFADKCTYSCKVFINCPESHCGVNGVQRRKVPITPMWLACCTIDMDVVIRIIQKRSTNIEQCKITSGLHKQLFLDLHLFVKLRKLCSRNSRDHVPGRSWPEYLYFV